MSKLRQLINEEHLDRISDKISWILALQEAKKEHGYTVSKEQMSKELYASELWCSILIHSLNSLFITHGQMKRLVENEILDEYDMSALLKEKSQEQRDYEWYSEDLMGYDLDADTVLRIVDVLEEAEPIMRKILGICG